MNVTRWNSDFIGAVGAPGAWRPAGDWADDTGPSTFPGAIGFGVGASSGNAASSAGVAMSKGPKLTTLASFDFADGKGPANALFADAAGDLFGTTIYGGSSGAGTVFEIARTQGGYAAAPTTLVAFTHSDGEYPASNLIADVAGDLFGTTYGGGADFDGTVFEIVKTGDGYADAPTTLVSFTGADGETPLGGLIADAAGDLFGTTGEGGAANDGTVFEIVKTQGGYAPEPTTLVSFTGADGLQPTGNLILDAAGDLFGVTSGGGVANEGTVFEIARTQGGYADAPTTLVAFTGADGAYPDSVIADAAGDLLGETGGGGADNVGTVYEIAKTEGGYADTPTTLVSFGGADGGLPQGGLILDADGNLFGTTSNGGTGRHGTVFEIATTQGGYAGAPDTTLFNFKNGRGRYPSGALIADAAGNLLGTTELGGSNGDGTVFEIKHSGFAPPTAPAPPAG